jgi:hypothetical protein
MLQGGKDLSKCLVINIRNEYVFLTSLRAVRVHGFVAEIRLREWRFVAAPTLLLCINVSCIALCAARDVCIVLLYANQARRNKYYMKHLFATATMLLLVSSCSVNLIRPIRTDAYDLDEEEARMYSSLAGNIDTLLTIRSGDCQPYSEDHLFFIYKKAGHTSSKAFCPWYKLRQEATMTAFNWDTIYNNLDRVRIEEATLPPLTPSVKDGDTSWLLTDYYSHGIIWSFRLLSGKDTIEWFHSMNEKEDKSSLVKARLADYIFAETRYKMTSPTFIYGKPKYKYVPIITFGRR